MIIHAGPTNRHYRGVLAVLQNAITTWNALPNVQFVANLGDIIDGQTEFKNLGSEEGLARVLKVFEKLRKAVPVIHMIGNHELYNFKRFASWALLSPLFPVVSYAQPADYVHCANREAPRVDPGATWTGSCATT